MFDTFGLCAYYVAHFLHTPLDFFVHAVPDPVRLVPIFCPCSCGLLGMFSPFAGSFGGQLLPLSLPSAWANNARSVPGRRVVFVPVRVWAVSQKRKKGTFLLCLLLFYHYRARDLSHTSPRAVLAGSSVKGSLFYRCPTPYARKSKKPILSTAAPFGIFRKQTGGSLAGVRSCGCCCTGATSAGSFSL